MSRGECARLRENVPYVKVHRYNPKHLIYPKLNGYGEIMAREKFGLLAVPRTVTVFACCYPYTAHVRPSVSQPSQAHSASLSTDVKVTVNCNSILLDIHVIQYCWIFMCHVKCLET